MDKTATLTPMQTYREQFVRLKNQLKTLRREMSQTAIEINLLKLRRSRLTKPRPHPVVRARFLELCAEIKADPSIVSGHSKSSFLKHQRAYLTWRLRQMKHEDDKPFSYPDITAVIRPVGTKHGRIIEWFRLAEADPKFQRPPQEGEYGN